MPIETKPNLRVFQYWFTESFLPWNIAKNYIKTNDVLSLLNIKSNPQNPYKQTFKKVRIVSGKINLAGTSAAFPSEAPKPTWPEGSQINIKDNDYVQVANYTQGSGIGSRDVAKWVSTLGQEQDNYGDVVLEFASALLDGDLQEVLKDMLTYRYNYDRKFTDAKYDEKGNPINKSSVLRQKFEGQKPEDVIDGLFENWKFKNHDYLKKDGVKRFKQVLYMLSNYVYSKYAINKGYNDDIKIIAPYYFELVSQPKKDNDEYYWEFNECRVKLQSFYFNFSDNNIKITNNDISQNSVYQLEANYFNWLSITNELETNNIPSLIPAEIKLSDGEYGKYLINLIISDSNLEKALTLFSSKTKYIYSKSEWIEEILNINNKNIQINFSKHLLKLNQIEISGIWGYGRYEISIFTEKEQININNLELFNKNNETLSLITLEI